MSLVDRDLVAEEREAARRGALPPRAPRRPGMDDGTRWLALVAGGIGALLVATVGGWSLLGHRAENGIPVIEPLPGPVRVKPVDPGGMQVMSTQVAQTNGPAAQALAPAPEAADPQALQKAVEAARRADAPPAAVARTVGAPVTEVPPAAASTPAAGPSVAAPAATPVAAAPVAAAPVPPQRAVPGPVSGDGGDAGAEADASAAAPGTGAVTVPGGHAVQLAALDSEAAAQAEWGRLARRAPSLFAKRDPAIMPVSRDGKRFFRLRTAGFASAAEASAFCGRLHGAGIACTVADF